MTSGRSDRLTTLGAAAAIAALSGLAAMPAAISQAPPLWLVAVVAAVALAGLWMRHEALRARRDALELIASGLHALAHGQMPSAAMLELGRRRDRIGAIAELVGEMANTRSSEAALPDQRLAAVIGVVEEGVVVVTDSGLISLMNAPARHVLGPKVALGTSIFAALERQSLLAAMHRARRAGQPQRVELHAIDGRPLPARLGDFGEHRGAVVILPADGTDPALSQGVEVALHLHDVPPAAPTPSPATLLTELPVLVLDTETTGLDVASDAILSIGAVRTHGPRLFRATVFDRLVDPARHIPARATAIHGIDDAMVQGRPAIAEVLPELLELMRGTVVVGHNIAFDLALLERAAHQAGLHWPDPPSLDIVLLAGAVAPSQRDLNLPAMAGRLGINVSGLHTALGDALVTAEVWVRLIHQLASHGVRTLGEAQAFSARARHLLAHQRSLGWLKSPASKGDVE